MTSGADILSDMADGAAVFQDVFPGTEIPECHFVAHGNVVERNIALSCRLDFRVFCNIAESNCNIVARVDT